MSKSLPYTNSIRLAHGLSKVAGVPIEPSKAPLANPWAGVLDGALANQIGFIPEIATV